MIDKNTPLRKARSLLGLTTAEAGQYVHVTRKTWEAWEAKEAAGQPVPAAAMELFFSKLDALAKRLRNDPTSGTERKLVVVFFRDPLSGADTPADVVSNENYLGNVQDPDDPDCYIIKSLAVDRTGKPYVHRTRYVKEHNQHVLAFCRLYNSVAD
jgi:DNA-binding XRE family transcriptional regulator